MEKEIEQSKLQMRNFKLNKLVVMLNSLVCRNQRNLKYSTFSHLHAHSLDLGLKAKKLEKHRIYDMKHKIIKQWLAAAKAIVTERELEEYEY